MEFVDLIFIVGLFLLGVGLYSAFSLLRLSITKTKEELKDHQRCQSLGVIHSWIGAWYWSRIFLV